MNETLVTLRGYLGGPVKLRYAGDVPVAGFRLGCTPSRLNRTTGEWVDAETQWYTVNAWRRLGENCEQSLKTGDPVVVHGRLSVRTFVNSDNVEQTTLEVEATSVGHDLHRGTTVFTKPVRFDQPVEQAAAAPAASGAETPAA